MLTFLVIAPKLKELQSCATIQIEDKNFLSPSIMLKIQNEWREAPKARVFVSEIFRENTWLIWIFFKAFSLYFL